LTKAERRPAGFVIGSRDEDGRDGLLSVGPGASAVGRVVWSGGWALEERSLVLDTGAGRFTGASVAGIVVAAWCSFVFGLTLRRWLMDRRARLRAHGAGAACVKNRGA